MSNAVTGLGDLLLLLRYTSAPIGLLPFALAKNLRVVLDPSPCLSRLLPATHTLCVSNTPPSHSSSPPHISAPRFLCVSLLDAPRSLSSSFFFGVCMSLSPSRSQPILAHLQSLISLLFLRSLSLSGPLPTPLQLPCLFLSLSPPLLLRPSPCLSLSCV